MAGDAVKIVLEAEDKASAQAINASRNIENAVKGVKETGQKAKASTEFIGVLAGQLGGSQFQAAAQGIAGITEKVGQFSEVMKAGGMGAKAFQAGITLLVTTLSFNLGKSLGEAIFGVQELKDEFADAQAEIDGFIGKMSEVSNRKFKEQLESINLIRDPVKQQTEAAMAFQAIQDQINDAYDVFHHRQTELEKLRGQFDPFGDNTDTINQLQLEANSQNEIIANLEKQKWALSDLYGERANSIKQIKEQQKLEDERANKAKQTEASVIAQLRKTNYQYIELTKGIDAARAAQLKDEGVSDIDAKRIIGAEKLVAAEKEKAEAKRKADEDEKARFQRVEDLQKSEMQRLEEQRVLLTQGEEAAARFRLEQQGLSKDAAARIAAEQAAIDKQKKQSELAKKLTEKPQLMAVEQRLVMRGASEDIQKDIASNTLKTVERLDAVAEAIKQLPKGEAKDTLQLELVS